MRPFLTNSSSLVNVTPGMEGNFGWSTYQGPINALVAARVEEAPFILHREHASSAARLTMPQNGQTRFPSIPIASGLASAGESDTVVLVLIQVPKT